MRSTEVVEALAAACSLSAMLPKSLVVMANWLMVDTTTSTARPSSMPSAAATARMGPIDFITPSASRPALASSLMALATSTGLRPMATPIFLADSFSLANCSSVAPVLAFTPAMALVKSAAVLAARTNGAPSAAPPMERFVPICRIDAPTARSFCCTRVMACWNLPSLANISTYAPPALMPPALMHHLQASRHLAPRVSAVRDRCQTAGPESQGWPPAAFPAPGMGGNCAESIFFRALGQS